MECWLVLLLLYFISPWESVDLIFVEVPIKKLQPIIFSSSQPKQSYKSVRIINDVFYIGGNGLFFLQKLENISSPEADPITWGVSESERLSCDGLPQSITNPSLCDNIISIIQPYNDTHLLLCGTKALHPSNILFNIKDKTLHKLDDTQTPLCSYDPSDSVTSILATQSGDFSSIAATSRDLREKIAVVKNFQDSNYLKTSQGEGAMIGDNPTFVNSFASEVVSMKGSSKKLYFVFGENSAKNGYASRIAQVCANDEGGAGKFGGSWTSFLKTELVCQSKERKPTKFNVITHSTITTDGVLFATFKTQSAQFPISAVCSFKLSDIKHAFNYNNFLEEGDVNKEVQPPESVTDRPGMCAYPGLGNNSVASSKNFPSDFLNFITKHPVVTSPTPSFPLYTVKDQTFEKIAVLQVSSLAGVNYVILFIATDDMNIVKYVSSEENALQNINLEPSSSKNKITGLDINPFNQQVYIKTTKEIIQLSAANCEIYNNSCEECDPCRMCVLSRDPMCAWDINDKVCTSTYGKSKSGNLIQDVKHGNVDKCKPLKKEVVQKTVPVYGNTEVLGFPLNSKTVKTKWGKLTAGTYIPIEADDKYYPSGHGRLEINDFQESDDGTYICERIAANTTVAYTSFEVNNFLISTLHPIPSSKPEESTGTDGTLIKINNTTVITTTSTEVVPPNSEPNVASISGEVIAILVISLLLVLICVCVAIFYWRKWRSHENRYNIDEGKTTKNFTATDSVAFRPESNNSNNKLLGMDSSLSKIELTLEEKGDELHVHTEKKSETPVAATATTTATPRQVAAIKPVPKEGLSSSPTLPFIDDPENATLPSPRTRKTPQRTKSIPAQNVLVQLTKDQSFRCKRATLTKRGTWQFEVDISDYMIINNEEGQSNNDANRSFGSVNDLDDNKTTPSSQNSETSGLLADEVLQAFDSKFLPRQEVDTDSDSTIKAYVPNRTFADDETSSLLSSQPNTSQNSISSASNSRLRQLQATPPISVRDKSARNEKSPRSTTSTDSSSSSADKFHTAPPSPLKSSNSPLLT